MSEAERGARRVHHAAEHEARRKRGEATPSGKVHVDLTEAKQGRPPLNRDWRDKPVDEEHDKDIKEGGSEGAARRER